MLTKFKTYLQLMIYSGRLMAGKRFWIVIFMPLVWPILQALFIAVGCRDGKVAPVDAHMLMSLPLTIVAMGLGLRIIAGEIDSRTLEIAYTVPGGCHRVWLAKLATCFCLLFAGDVLLAVFIMVFLTSVSIGTFYGVLQASVFYLVMGMALSAFFRSEITGAMATVGLLAVNILIQFAVHDVNGGAAQFRISPFFNPLALADKSQIISNTIQNRILFVILIVVISLLTFLRVERREKMLRD